jgi:hypothetical protein
MRFLSTSQDEQMAALKALSQIVLLKESGSHLFLAFCVAEMLMP